MRLFKTIAMSFLIFSLFTAEYCESDTEDTCQDCIDAQVNYCEAYQAGGGSTTANSTASGQVLDLCPNGAAKLAAIRYQILYEENYGCGGFTCK